MQTKKRNLTQTEKLARKNAAAIKKMRRGEAETNELHEKVRRGEMTAGEALLEKKRLTDSRRLGPGRPRKPLAEQARRVLITITAEADAIALRIGNGKRSRGVQAALMAAGSNLVALTKDEHRAITAPH
jgi:hypothetical protein